MANTPEFGPPEQPHSEVSENSLPDWMLGKTPEEIDRTLYPNRGARHGEFQNEKRVVSTSPHISTGSSSEIQPEVDSDLYRNYGSADRHTSAGPGVDSPGTLAEK